MAFLAAQGQVTSVATMRAMVRTRDGAAALVEPKAVDAGYPSVGTLVLDPPMPPAELFADRDGAFGRGRGCGPVLAAGPEARRRGAAGRSDARAARAARIGARQAGSRHQFRPAPPALARTACARRGLLQPGSLVRWSYRALAAEQRVRRRSADPLHRAICRRRLPEVRASRCDRASTPRRSSSAISSGSASS